MSIFELYLNFIWTLFLNIIILNVRTPMLYSYSSMIESEIWCNSSSSSAIFFSWWLWLLGIFYGSIWICKRFFLLYKEYHKDFDGDRIESVKPSWQNEHFHNINSIDLWVWWVFPSSVSSLISFIRDLRIALHMSFSVLLRLSYR